MEEKLTAAMEDYLESIYLLELKNKVARVSDVGKRMNVRKASVVSAVSMLQKHGLLNHEKYGFITLTESGKTEAEKIYRKHEVLSAFLKDDLKVPPEQAANEACMMEHALSDDTINRLLVFVKQARKAVAKQEREAAAAKKQIKKKK